MLNWKLEQPEQGYFQEESDRDICNIRGENRAAGISRPEACTGREGHSFLCLLYSVAQVGSYVTKITSVYLYMFH